MFDFTKNDSITAQIVFRVVNEPKRRLTILVKTTQLFLMVTMSEVKLLTKCSRNLKSRSLRDQRILVLRYHSLKHHLTLRVLFFIAEKLEKPDKPDAERSSPLKQGAGVNSKVMSLQGSGQQQVCVMLQPPLPSLSNKSSSPTSLGSLADNVRPSSVPIILAPSPALLSRSLSSPLGFRSPTPTDPDSKQLQLSKEGPGDETGGVEPAKPESASSPRAKSSIHDI